MTPQPYPLMRLGDLVERVESGVSVRSFDERAGPDEKGVLKVSAVSAGRFDPTENKRIRADELARAATHPVAGCTLVSRANTLALVGEVGYVEHSRTDVYLPDKLWQLHPRHSVVDPYWFSLLLDSPLVREPARLNATGTSGSMKNISQGAYFRIEVPVPPLDQQRRTATALRLLRKATDNASALLSAKRALKRALLHKLLTGGRRLPVFASAAPWQSVPLGDLVVSVTRRNANGSAERVLTCSGEHGLIDQRQFFSKLVAGESREGYFLLKRGEFAYNRSAMGGYPYGATKRLDRYDSGVVSTLNICFALTNESCTSDFLLHLFESGLLNQQLGRIARVGSRAHGLLNVTKSEFFRIEVRLPSVAEQERIASALNAADREIALLERLRDAHEAQKRALMQRLLAGDLPLPAPASAADLAHA